MDHQKLQPYFLLILIFVLAVLVFFLLKPVFAGLVLAAVLAVVFHPLKQSMLIFTRGRASLASFFSTVLIICLILVPLSLLGTQIVREAQSLYQNLAVGQWSAGKVFSQVSAGELQQYLQQALSWLISRLGSIFSSVAKVMLNLLVFFIALYYFLRDGGRFKRAVVLLSPLSDARDEFVLNRLVLAVNSVVRGNLLIALIQGLLTAIGFSIFGVPHFVLWGLMAALAALIPGFGTALVIAPAIVYLFLTAHTGMAIGLLIWGILAVGLIDNLLGPALVGRGMRLHPLLVLLAVIGGLALFGPTGFVLGPLVMSLLFALLDIYSNLSGIAQNGLAEKENSSRPQVS